jgi:hypothetical protein
MPGLALPAYPSDTNPSRVWTNPGAKDATLVLLTPAAVYTARLSAEEGLAAVKALAAGDPTDLALGPTRRELPLAGLLEVRAALKSNTVRLVQPEGLLAVETRVTFANPTDLDEFFTALRGRLNQSEFELRQASRGFARTAGILLSLLFAVVALTAAGALAARPTVVVRRPESALDRLLDWLGPQGVVIIGASLALVLAGVLVWRLRAQPDMISLVKRL